MTIPETSHDLIRHPVWCRKVDEKAPLAGDPVGFATFYDRMAPAEPETEHEGREYRLDAGRCFSYGLTVSATQVFEQTPDGVSDSEPQIKLDVVMHDFIGQAVVAYLSLEDVDRLVAMLRAAQRDLRRG